MQKSFVRELARRLGFDTEISGYNEILRIMLRHALSQSNHSIKREAKSENDSTVSNLLEKC